MFVARLVLVPLVFVCARRDSQGPAPKEVLRVAERAVKRCLKDLSAARAVGSWKTGPWYEVVVVYPSGQARVAAGATVVVSQSGDSVAVTHTYRIPTAGGAIDSAEAVRVATALARKTVHEQGASWRVVGYAGFDGIHVVSLYPWKKGQLFLDWDVTVAVGGKGRAGRLERILDHETECVTPSGHSNDGPG